MADTIRMKALQNLSNQLPVANSRVAKGQKAAQTMQVQRAVATAPTAAPIQPTAAQTGTAVAQNAGADMIQNAQTGLQQQGQVAQLGQTEQKLANQATAASQQMGAREAAMTQEERFAALDQKLKKELYDDHMKFQKDELGRTKFNEVQMADYAKSNAKSQEEYNNYAQRAEILSKRKMQALEHAHKLIMEDLNQKHLMAEKNKDQEAIIEIELMKKGANEAMAREAARAANKAAAWKTGGMIVGGALGSMGGPAGALAGSMVGGAIGSAIGSGF